MPIPQFLRITTENVYKTFDTSTPDYQFYFPLEDGNTFSVRETVLKMPIRDFAGSNRRRAQYGKRKAYIGTLSGLLYADKKIAKFLFMAATQRINSGQTTPWVSDQCEGDLCSFSAEHAILNTCAAYERSRFTGGKIRKFSARSAVGSDDAWRFTAEIEFSAKSSDPDGTAFPAPSLSDFATSPFVFTDTTLTLGTSRTQFRSISFEVNNVLAPQYFIATVPQRLTWRGRDANIGLEHLLVSSPDDRSNYEAQTSNTVEIGITDGTNTITIDCYDVNIMRTIEDQMPLNEDFFQAIGLENFLDVSGDNDDFGVTYSGFSS